MFKKIIKIDCDGVLRNMLPLMCDLYNDYYDDNFVDDNSENETQKTTTDNTKTRQQTLTKVRNTTEYQNLILYLRNDYLCDTIFTDINDISTLSIYE